jgi:hypothetical protein
MKASKRVLVPVLGLLLVGGGCEATEETGVSTASVQPGGAELRCGELNTWPWYSYLCLLCGIQRYQWLIAQVLESGAQAHEAACELQNARLQGGGCLCGDSYVNPWFTSCRNGAPSELDLQRALQGLHANCFDR